MSLTVIEQHYVRLVMESYKQAPATVVEVYRAAFPAMFEAVSDEREAVRLSALDDAAAGFDNAAAFPDLWDMARKDVPKSALCARPYCPTLSLMEDQGDGTYALLATFNNLGNHLPKAEFIRHVSEFAAAYPSAVVLDRQDADEYVHVE